MQKAHHLLALDIGNTSTSAALFRQGSIQAVHRLDHRNGPAPDAMCRMLDALSGGKPFSGAVIACVVPRFRKCWMESVHNRCEGPVIDVSWRSRLHVRLSYPRPETIGADRLANVCAAAVRYGSPAIIADFGTALTFDVLSKSGCYTGGVIAPGLPLMFDYLAEKTALLPHIAPAPIKRPSGKSTEEAMHIGARNGYRGMVRGILDPLLEKMGPETTVIATGGYAGWVFRKWNQSVIVDKHLTLYGLATIFSLNTELD